MDDQLRIPGLDPPGQLRPSPQRTVPSAWVRRLRVLDALDPDPAHVVRDVEFRRGLNIIWAPPHDVEGNALFQTGVSGHTAGKTTLCRLVRYVLGERTFAAEITRRRIRQAFPSGWVLGEVIVDGLPWVVARPLGLGAHPFCLRDAGLEAIFEEVQRLDLSTYLEALEAMVGDLPVTAFPTTDLPVQWEHLLPWLTRDQECRFSEFLEWRHPSSDSQSTSLTVDERQFLMRSVLGLISDEERAEQHRNARLVAERKTASERAPLLAHQATVEHGRVEGILGMTLNPPSSGLFGQDARRELDRRTEELRTRIAAHSADDLRPALREALERAVSAETNAQRDLNEVKGRLAVERAAVEELDADVRGDAQTALLAALPPSRDYCNVPLELARERGCPLAQSRPHSLAEHRSQRTAAEELAAMQAVVAAIEVDVVRKKAALAAAEADTSRARRAFLVASTEFDEQRGGLLEERAQLRQAARLVDNAERAWRESSKLAAAVTALGADIDESYKRQEAARKRISQALGRFSATFDYVVRALLGDEVEGRVDASGRSLSLVVEHQGERDSAAFGTVKLLAFDLAALTASVEGRGHAPRLLVHDGPREADMASDIYERLFLFGRSLEQCFEGEAGFQYIVTTTTRPPAELSMEPWLRLELEGAPAERRLLRRDL